MDLRSTLNLPDPSFTIPMKADLPKLEPSIQARWDEIGIYHRILEARAGAPDYVFHDGPPYTNDEIHLGTALNKILKDFVVKSRTMLGYRTPYVPGYDNHGLPIEQSVMKKFHEEKKQPSTVELRKACREHAQKYIDVQTSQFKRLGVFGLWEKPYRTMDYRFEAEIIRVFKRMVQGGYVYKDLRPTLWSPTARTALADTEIVYKDHTSKAIYVRFPLLHDRNGFSKDLPNFYTIIWTTTPWTIPANLAVAFHPTVEYAVVSVGDSHYLIANDLVGSVAEALKWEEFKVLYVDLGASFEGSSFKHPIFNRPSVCVLADYVTTEDGTGVVHTAPGHGREDFYTGKKYGLDILCPVDERGVLTAEASEFEGVFYADCDKVVVDRLAEVGALLDVRDYVHSYPHAERDSQPVIFRATEQWFVGIDRHDLRDRMLEQIPEVTWLPANGQNRIEAMVANRPDWCISRQRPWGVGIPVFYGKKSRKPVLDPVAIESVAKLVEQEGSDAWFERDPKATLPPDYRDPATGESEFTKETDVLDVWFDSGSTSLVVLEGNVEPEWKERWPADLYFEGSDQHRGWFNSSLVIGTAVRGQAPYKAVVTHGFVNDEQGRKMSKRLGNVVDPTKACNQYGADVLRYWVASVEWENDVPCSDNLLKSFGEHYRTVRNTLRFLLGNLYDFTPHDADARALILDLDRWVMEQVDLLCVDCVRAYESFDYGSVITSVHNFCTNELSRFYLDAIKDRMYCDGRDWASRLSGQIAQHYVLVRLVKLIAPILSHTAEETWQRVPAVSRDAAASDFRSVHFEEFDVPSVERLEEIEGSDFQARFGAVLETRAEIAAAFESWKEQDGIKDSQDVVVAGSVPAARLELLKTFSDEDLAIYFRMSWVELMEGEPQFSFKKSPFEKCERSRVRRPDVEQVDWNGEKIWLSKRDRRALGV
ncbi:MAG TPA: isoleucine--tRNA ligase [Fimbriimonadaceae bacterium]|nr:isoleucine--tRNA ligase [Fimbriimonadaceae bacterium]